MSRLDYSKALFGKRDAKAPSASAQRATQPQTRTRYGVVQSYDANSGIATVLLDGSVDNSGSPVAISITSDVPLEQGQRITVIISGTDITVIPDETSIGVMTDEAAKVATNYINFDQASGLVVGNLTDSTLKGNIQIANKVIGGVETPGVWLRNGTTELAKFIPGSIQLGSSANTASSIVFNGDGSTFGTLITYSPSVASNSPTHTNNKLYKVTRFRTMEAEAILESTDTSGVRQARLHLDAANPSSGTYTDEAVSSTVSASRTYAQTASFVSIVSCTAGGSGVSNGVATIDIEATASAVSGVTVAPSSINMTADQMTFNSSPIHVAATAKNSSSRTLTSSYAVIPLATIESSDTNHLARVGSLNTYGINVKSDGKILISASLYATGVTASDNIGIEITDGNAVIKGPFALQTGSGGIGIITIPPFIYTVSEGAYIYLQAKTSAGGGTVAAGDAYMTVQYI